MPRNYPTITNDDIRLITLLSFVLYWKQQLDCADIGYGKSEVISKIGVCRSLTLEIEREIKGRLSPLEARVFHLRYVRGMPWLKLSLNMGIRRIAALSIHRRAISKIVKLRVVDLDLEYAIMQDHGAVPPEEWLTKNVYWYRRSNAHTS